MVLVDRALVGAEVPLVVRREALVGQVGLVDEAPVDQAQALLGPRAP